MFKQRFDLRAFMIVTVAMLIGALWAGYNLWSVLWGPAAGNVRGLVWAVFATPFATFLGWAVVRGSERWRAAFACFVIYFFTILTAARIERLLIGEDRAGATNHALYFELTLALQIICCLGVALRLVGSVGTMKSPNEVTRRSTPPKP